MQNLSRFNTFTKLSSIFGSFTGNPSWNCTFIELCFSQVIVRKPYKNKYNSYLTTMVTGLRTYNFTV